MLDYSNDELGDYYLLFRKKEDIDSYIAHEIEPTMRFRACDSIDYHSGSTEHNGVSKKKYDYLTIKTTARIDIKEDDWLYDIKNDKKWKVQSFIIADDGKQKRLRLRPRKWTYIDLIGKM